MPQAGETYWHWLLSLSNNPDIWQIYQNELLQIHHVVQERDDKLIVVVFPELQALEDSRPLTLQVVNLYREQGVPVLDVAELIGDMDPAELVVSSVDSHPNEFMHSLVAEKLYQLVLDSQPKVD